MFICTGKMVSVWPCGTWGPVFCSREAFSGVDKTEGRFSIVCSFFYPRCRYHHGECQWMTSDGGRWRCSKSWSLTSDSFDESQWGRKEKPSPTHSYVVLFGFQKNKNKNIVQVLRTKHACFSSFSRQDLFMAGSVTREQACSCVGSQYWRA